MSRRVLGKRIGVLLEDEILDEAEQAELVHSFQKMQESQERIWRVVLGWLSFLLASLLVFDAWLQWGEPWGRRHHAMWEDYVSAFWLTGLEVAQGLALCLCGMEFLLPKQCAPRVRPISVALACSAIMGTCAILKLTQTSEPHMWLRIDFLWLPVLPCAFCCAMFIPLKSFHISKTEVAGLRDKMYDFKKL